MEVVSSARVMSMGFSAEADTEEGDGDKTSEGIR